MTLSLPGPVVGIPKKLSVFLLVMQLIMLIFFICFGKYDEHGAPRNVSRSLAVMHNRVMLPPQAPPVPHEYSMFQDVHMMIFMGFGFLYAFLQRYGYSGVGYNFLLGGYTIQWALIVRGLIFSSHFTEHAPSIDLNPTAMLTAEFVGAAVLVSFGVLMGKASLTQVVVMATIEVPLVLINEWICVHKLQIADMGLSVLVHSFAAYFGLAISRVLNNKEQYDHSSEGSEYHSDIFALIGTIFLWAFWPSFNSVMAPGDSQYRAICNTYLSIAASCMVAFALSPMLNKNKINMVHIQNATLAGGVAVGAVADMLIQPWGAVTIGCVAGTISVLGYQYIQPALAKFFLIHDTCGVNNLHGMPGLLSGLASVFAALAASPEHYSYSLCLVFAARCTHNNPFVEARSAAMQAALQAAAIGITLAISIMGGALTGFLLKFLDPLPPDQFFEDEQQWMLPESEDKDSLKEVTMIRPLSPTVRHIAVKADHV